MNINEEIAALETVADQITEPDVVEEEEVDEEKSADDEVEEKSADEEIVETDDAEVSDETVDDEEKSALEEESTDSDPTSDAVKAVDDLLTQMSVEDDQDTIEEKIEAPAVADGEFLCGVSRKSAQTPCDFCRGGCAPEGDLPGLKTIEEDVLSSLPEGAAIVTSGYSNVEDIYVVDVKVADDDYREAFVSGSGKQLGWLAIDSDYVEKAADMGDVISSDDAAELASNILPGETKGVEVGFFYDTDAYVVELEAEAKSYDVFVSIDGKVLGYDEFEIKDDDSEDVEIKELEDDLADRIAAAEAEIRIKRAFSQEERASLAESGVALPDGSFPIVDETDLQNAIQAHGRADDVETAKRHIVKRAQALNLTDLLPDGWLEEAGDNGDESAEEAAPSVSVEEEKTAEEDVATDENILLEDDIALMAELAASFSDDTD